MSETILTEPYVVPREVREIRGTFRAGPGFRLRGASGPGGWTPTGLLNVPEDHPGVDIAGVKLFGAPHLDVNSPDWMVSQVRGIHINRARNVRIRETEIEDIPLEAIWSSGTFGLDVSWCRSRRTLTFLSCHYFNATTVAQARPNRDTWIRNCFAEDLRSAKGHPALDSVLYPGFSVAGAAIYLACNLDAEVTDFASCGETGGGCKSVDGERIRFARIIGPRLMVQGSCYWDAVRGPHSIAPSGQLPWPLGPGSFAKKVTVEDCHFQPRVSLHDLYDNPEFGGNTLQISWPQEETVIRRNHLWWETHGVPPVPYAYACIQLAEGVKASIYENVFHKASGPADHHGIYNAESGNFGDSAHAKWPSSIVNADWREKNLWVPTK